MQDMVEMAGFQPMGRARVRVRAIGIAVPRRNAPELYRQPTLQKQRAQGRPGASSHPRPVCIGSKHTVVTTGGAGIIPAFPAQWF